MSGLDKIHLERLHEIASNFNSEERKAVLSAISEEDIRNYLATLHSKATRTWLIAGPGLPTIEIVADSFDNALAEARILDARYSAGQVKEG